MAPARCSVGMAHVARAARPSSAPDPVLRQKPSPVLRCLCPRSDSLPGPAPAAALGKSCDSCRAGGESPGAGMQGLCLRFPWAAAAPANRRLSQRAKSGRDAAPACRGAGRLAGALAGLWHRRATAVPGGAAGARLCCSRRRRMEQTKARPVLCVHPRGAQPCRHSVGPVTWGRAAPCASAPITADSGHRPRVRAQRPSGCGDAEFEQRINPVPNAGTERAVPIGAKSRFLITDPTRSNQPSPGAPAVGVSGRAAPRGAQPSWDGGRWGLFWELDGCPGQEAANPGPRKAVPKPAHSVPASAGTAASFACHPPRSTAALTLHRRTRASSGG